jgi:hypothetical protein
VSENRLSSYLSKKEKTEFYEHVLRLAVQSQIPHCASDWPASYVTEIFQAQKQTGHLAYQTKVIPTWHIDGLVDDMHLNVLLNAVDWAKDFFFLHTIRGTKHGTQHAINAEAAHLALQEYLKESSVTEGRMSEGKWWVDVGLEFSSRDNCCLQWKTSSHYHLVRGFLNISQEHASCITRTGSSKYAHNFSSHLPAVSGCRIEPGAQAKGPYKAVYFHMYTTEKALTYNLEGGHYGKAIMMDKAMSKDQPPNFVASLLTLYEEAITQGTKLASWCLKNLGDYLKKAQLLGIVYLSNVAEKF